MIQVLVAGPHLLLHRGGPRQLPGNGDDDNDDPDDDEDDDDDKLPLLKPGGPTPNCQSPYSEAELMYVHCTCCVNEFSSSSSF